MFGPIFPPRSGYKSIGLHRSHGFFSQTGVCFFFFNIQSKRTKAKHIPSNVQVTTAYGAGVILKQLQKNRYKVQLSFGTLYVQRSEVTVVSPPQTATHHHPPTGSASRKRKHGDLSLAAIQARQRAAVLARQRRQKELRQQQQQQQHNNYGYDDHHPYGQRFNNYPGDNSALFFLC